MTWRGAARRVGLVGFMLMGGLLWYFIPPQSVQVQASQTAAAASELACVPAISRLPPLNQGEKRAIPLRFLNSSKDHWWLSGIRVQCGCLRLLDENLVLSPESTTDCRMVFDSRSRFGSIDMPARFQFQNAAGRVIEVEWSLNTEVLRQFWADPAELNLTDVCLGSARQAVVSVRCRDRGNVTLVASSNSPEIAMDRVEKQAEEYRVCINITPMRHAGRRNANLTLHIKDSALDPLVVPVSFSVPSRFKVEPMRLTVIAENSATWERTANLRIAAQDKQGFRVEVLELPPWLGLDSARALTASNRALRLLVKPDAVQPGAVRGGEILLKTDDETESLIRIPAFLVGPRKPAIRPEFPPTSTQVLPPRPPSPSRGTASR